jgi:hypothetical protein
VSKARAELDEWCTDVAPSDALRKWYGHSPEKFEEFQEHLRVTLDRHQSSVVPRRCRDEAAGASTPRSADGSLVAGTHRHEQREWLGVDDWHALLLMRRAGELLRPALLRP